jgi:hypothetical protein
MSAPTTSILLNQVTPAPPSGDQTVIFVSDGATPLQSITAYPKAATSTLRGTALAVPGIATLVIDGGGSVPATGAKGFIQCPYAGTITGWTMLGDVSGSAQITVSKGTYAAFPTVSSIVASAPPKLTTAQKNTSTTLTGWTTAVAVGDILSFNLDSVLTCTRITLELQITRT